MLSFAWKILCLLFAGLTESLLHTLLLWEGVWREWRKSPGFEIALARLTVNLSSAHTRSKAEFDLQTKPQ